MLTQQVKSFFDSWLYATLRHQLNLYSNSEGLSGNSIPDVLPPEMVPPSSKDLDSSVDFLKDLLRKDTHSRSTNLDQNAGDNQSNRYAKIRSFAGDASPEPASVARKDAAVYRHNDGDVKTYKSTSRHLDRRNVRFQGEEESSDFDDLKKQLSSSQDLLERSYKAEDENEDLKAEIDDLKYRIKRVQEDIEFNKSGRRTEAKDNERRRLERELLFLMHEKLPELEDKKREADRQRRSEDRAAARKRDSRNGRSRRGQKYSHADNSGTSSDSQGEDDRGYLRGSYGSNSRDARQSSQNQRSDSEGNNIRGESQSRLRVSPPASPRRSNKDTRHAEPEGNASPTLNSRPKQSTAHVNMPHAPASNASQPVQSKPPATAEERQAFIRAEAQRRVQERMRMLTGQAPPTNGASPVSSASTYDNSVQARLEQDKAEAARKTEQEDAVLAERERQRQIKLEEERLRHSNQEKASVARASEALQSISNDITASEIKHSGDDGTASAAARTEIAEEEAALLAQGHAAAENAKVSEQRIRHLQKSGNSSGKKPPPLPPASRMVKATPKPPPPRSNKTSVSSPLPNTSISDVAEPTQSLSPPSILEQPVSGAVAEPSSPVGASTSGPTINPPSSATPTKSVSTNPFHRLGASTSSPALPVAIKGSSNPFFRPPTGASTSAEVALTKAPLVQPQAIRPIPQKEDDWGDMHQHNSEESDESDDEGATGAKEKRAGLAGLLFGGTSQSAPSSRPGSAKPTSPIPATKAANPALAAL